MIQHLAHNAVSETGQDIQSWNQFAISFQFANVFWKNEMKKNPTTVPVTN